MSDNKSSLARFLTARNLNDVIAQMIILLGERDKEKHGMGNQRRHIYKKSIFVIDFQQQETKQETPTFGDCVRQ